MAAELTIDEMDEMCRNNANNLSSNLLCESTNNICEWQIFTSLKRGRSSPPLTAKLM